MKELLVEIAKRGWSSSVHQREVEKTMKELLVEIAKRGWSLRIMTMRNTGGLSFQFRTDKQPPLCHDVYVPIRDLMRDDYGLVERTLWSTISVLQRAEDNLPPQVRASRSQSNDVL